MVATQQSRKGTKAKYSRGDQTSTNSVLNIRSTNSLYVVSNVREFSMYDFYVCLFHNKSQQAVVHFSVREIHL